MQEKEIKTEKNKTDNIISGEFKSAFEDAWADLNKKYKGSTSKEVLIPDRKKIKYLKMYMIENPTDRSLHKLQINQKKQQIQDKIGDIESDFKELDKMLNIKLKTIGMLASKQLKSKYKIIV